MNTLVSNALASVLRSGRDEFNRRFVEARRLYPDLEPTAFSGFLGASVDPLVQSVQAVRPDRVPVVVQAAYDIGLQLVGQRLAGPSGRQRAIDDGWQRLTPKVASLVADEPERMLASVSNALLNLAASPGCRPGEWISAMERAASLCTTPELFLGAGRTAAWRAGLAQYRGGALAAADGLSEEIVRQLLELPEGISWPAVRQRLSKDPWFDPSARAGAPSGPRIVGQVGGFRGLGGLFCAPPVAAATTGGHVLVRSGDDSWLLTADIFGATFHRAQPDERWTGSAATQLPSGMRLSGSDLLYQGGRIRLTVPGSVTSAASTATTLAVTVSHSHVVVLVALA